MLVAGHVDDCLPRMWRLGMSLAAGGIFQIVEVFKRKEEDGTVRASIICSPYSLSIRTERCSVVNLRPGAVLRTHPTNDAA